MSSFRYFEPNRNGKDFVCGDIHGCYSILERELRRIGFDKSKDRLFCVGDLTDGGLRSHLALDYLKEDWFYSVQGNHEDMVLQVWESKDPEIERWHWRNGGKWLAEMSDEWVEEYVGKIKELPLAIQVGGYGILHSRIPEHVHWDDFVDTIESYRDYILWERNDKINVKWTEGISGVFAGHTIHDTPVNYGNLCDIDTGAFLEQWPGENGRLTIVEMVHT